MSDNKGNGKDEKVLDFSAEADANRRFPLVADCRADWQISIKRVPSPSDGSAGRSPIGSVLGAMGQCLAAVLIYYVVIVGMFGVEDRIGLAVGLLWQSITEDVIVEDAE